MKNATTVDRREFLRMMGGGAAALLAGNALALDPPAQRPNVIVIVGDDLGYADLGCHGATDVKTPNIDALAKNGARFTDGYVSCPVCSPTRAGLMTGRYQQRFGHEFNPGAAANSAEFGLPLSQRTLADQMKAAGYATGMVGKWHLGSEPKFHPRNRGFDEYFGFLGGAHKYVDLQLGDSQPIMRGYYAVEEKEYLTDAFTREAVAFIERHQKEPFFLYLTYNAVHAPMTPPPKKYMDRFADIKDERRRILAAMLAAMDDGIGAVAEKLLAHGLEEKTLIFFISDNGGPTPVNTSRNDPLSGRKGEVKEGGIRVPFIAQWKGTIQPAVIKEPVIALDIFPTALAAAGGVGPKDVKLDGVDLLPLMTGKSKAAPHEILFWRFGAQSAARKGKWKLVKQGDQPVKLFDLAADPGEANDLSEKNADVKKELAVALAKWDSELVTPLWQGGGRRNRANRQNRPNQQ